MVFYVFTKLSFVKPYQADSLEKHYRHFLKYINVLMRFELAKTEGDLGVVVDS